MKFARLELLDNGVPKISPKTTDCGQIVSKVEKGQFHLTTNAIQPSIKPLFMMFANDNSPNIAIVQNYSPKSTTISIWNISLNKEVAVIQSGMMESVFCFVAAESGSKLSRFSFTSSQFSFLVLSDQENTIEFYKWKIPEYKGESIQLNPSDKQCLIIDPSTDKEFAFTINTITKDTKDTHVIKIDSYFDFSHLCFVSGHTDQPRILKKVALPTSEFPKLKDHKGEMYLFSVQMPTSNSSFATNDTKLWLYDALQEKKIGEYIFRDIWELTHQPESDEDDETMCTYDARFDQAKPQFIIAKEFLAGFVVYQYDGKSTSIVTKGSMFCHLSIQRRFVFINDCVIATCPKENEMLPMTPDALNSHADSDFVEVVVADLKSKQVQTVSSFGISSTRNSHLLLNEAHRTIACQPTDHLQVWPTIRPINEGQFAMLANKSSYIVLDFSLSPEEIAHKEAEAMYQGQLKKEKRLKEIEMSKRKEKEQQEARSKIVEKYLDSEEHMVEGTIYSWNATWGFMKPSGEAKHLGDIFVHKSNVTNRRHHLKKGQKIKCRITKDQGRRNFKALEIEVTTTQENGNNGASRFYRGHNSRGRRGNRGVSKS